MNTKKQQLMIMMQPRDEEAISDFLDSAQNYQGQFPVERGKRERDCPNYQRVLFFSSFSQRLALCCILEERERGCQLTNQPASQGTFLVSKKLSFDFCLTWLLALFLVEQAPQNRSKPPTKFFLHSVKSLAPNFLVSHLDTSEQLQSSMVNAKMALDLFIVQLTCNSSIVAVPSSENGDGEKFVGRHKSKIGLRLLRS